MNSYKLSKYNHYIPYRNKIIFFNAMSGALFLVEKNQYEIFNKLKNSLESLKKYKDFFDALEKSRFIINFSINELDIIRFRNHKDIFIDNKYILKINPTMECNFNCWYCYEKRIKGKMSDEVMQSIIKHVQSLVETNKISGLHLGWFGGEPLLYFDDIVYPLSKELIKIVKKYDLPFTNSITTNGYLLEENIISKLEKIEIKDYQITLDGCEDMHNKSRQTKNGFPTYRKIIDNINILCEKINNISILLRINYNDKTLNELHKIVKDINSKHKNKIKINFQRIWQTHDKTKGLNPKLKKMYNIFNNSGLSSNCSSFNLHSGFVCYADKYHSAVINFNGNVYKCTAQDFNEENKVGFLNKDGKIEWIPELIIKRFSKATFENEMCLKCNLLPICNGFCSQKLIGNKTKDDLNNSCVLYLNEMSVEDYIINLYKEELKQNINKSSKNK